MEIGCTCPITAVSCQVRQHTDADGDNPGASDAPGDRDGFFGEEGGSLALAACVRHVRQHDERLSKPPFGVEVAEQVGGFLIGSGRGIERSPPLERRSHAEEHASDPKAIIDGTGEDDSCLAPSDGRRVIALQGSQDRRREESIDSSRRRGVTSSQSGVDPTSAFAEVRPVVPKWDQRGSESQGGLRLAAIECPGERRSQVRQFLRQAIEGRDSLDAGQVGREVLAKSQEELCVPPSCLVLFPAAVEPFEPEFADDLQHRQARLPIMLS